MVLAHLAAPHGEGIDGRGFPGAVQSFPSLSIAASFLGETTYKRWIEVGSMGKNSHQLTPMV